jgi:1-acyl-sn-glycerol-3-phosphate acyltransferase
MITFRHEFVPATSFGLLDPQLRLTQCVIMTFKEHFVNFISSSFFKLTCKVEVRGVDNVPLKGPAILISNHTTIYEGPLFYLKLRPRKTRALAKKELWDHTFTRMAMEAWESVKVDRGGMDMKAIRGCFSVLDEGNFLCIAPEGTRSKTGALKKAMPGTTFFASRKGVPVFPFVQWGLLSLPENLKKLRRTSVTIVFGKPFFIEKPGGGKLSSDDREKMADEMMYRLAELLPENLRGHYADPAGKTSDYITEL